MVASLDDKSAFGALGATRNTIIGGYPNSETDQKGAFLIVVERVALSITSWQVDLLAVLCSRAGRPLYGIGRDERNATCLASGKSRTY